MSANKKKQEEPPLNQLKKTESVIQNKPGKMPSFALPEAVLHSIPLPPEFNEQVKDAEGENHVESPLPKFFNPLFRRQGVVNKHMIKALGSVGTSLAHLAHEIESRDKVLENLADYLNSFNENTDLQRESLRNFMEILATRIETAVSEQQNRLQEESNQSKLALATLADKSQASLLELAEQSKKNMEQASEQVFRLQAKLEMDLETALARTNVLLATSNSTGALISGIFEQLQEVQRNQHEGRSEDTLEFNQKLNELQNKLGGRFNDLKQDIQKNTTTQNQQDIAIGELDKKVAEGLESRQSDQQASEKRLVARLTQLETSLSEVHEELRSAKVENEARRQEAENKELERQNLRKADRESSEGQIQQLSETLKADRESSEGQIQQLSETLKADRESSEGQIQQLSETLKADRESGEGQIQQLSETLKADRESSEGQIQQLSETLKADRESSEGQIQQLSETLKADRESSEGQIQQLSETLKADRESSEGQIQQLSESLNQWTEILRSNLEGTSATQSELSDDQIRLREELLEMGASLADVLKKQDSLESRVGGLNHSVHSTLPALNESLVNWSRTNSKKSRTKALSAAQNANQSELDAFYMALEARFRGSESAIQTKQIEYLDKVTAVRQRITQFPPPPREVNKKNNPVVTLKGDGVLDLGCGRGEWLKLLREHNVPAMGVDQNSFFLADCRDDDLSVIDMDLLEFLKRIPDESVGVVTGFHIIEHLPLPILRETIDQTYRILRRGGAAIFETPNPGNLLTSCLNFHLDPTHIKPVHSGLAQFLLETAGFSAVSIEFKNPNESVDKPSEQSTSEQRRIHDLLFGPQDFAVIGMKP